MSDPLPILLGPGKDAPETLLLLGAPDAKGMVQVRSWTADDWSATPRTRDEQRDGLLQWIESQAATGRTMNQSLYAVRLWLRGASDAGR